MCTAEETSAAIDLSPDYIFESEGRLVSGGDEGEMHVPVKSLRFPPEQPQTWGINVVRRVQHAGQTHTWTRVRRGGPGCIVAFRDQSRSGSSKIALTWPRSVCSRSSTWPSTCRRSRIIW